MDELYASDPEAVAAARTLDRALRPITTAIAARLGLTESEVDARIAVLVAARREREGGDHAHPPAA